MVNNENTMNDQEKNNQKNIRQKMIDLVLDHFGEYDKLRVKFVNVYMNMNIFNITISIDEPSTLYYPLVERVNNYMNDMGMKLNTIYYNLDYKTYDLSYFLNKKLEVD